MAAGDVVLSTLFAADHIDTLSGNACDILHVWL